MYPHLNKRHGAVSITPWLRGRGAPDALRSRHEEVPGAAVPQYHHAEYRRLALVSRRPSYLRVATVHQGDPDAVKGVYIAAATFTGPAAKRRSSPMRAASGSTCAGTTLRHTVRSVAGTVAGFAGTADYLTPPTVLSRILCKRFSAAIG